MNALNTAIVVVRKFSMPIAYLFVIAAAWFFFGFGIAVATATATAAIYVAVRKRSEIKKLAGQFKGFALRKLADAKREIRHDVNALNEARKPYTEANAEVKKAKATLKDAKRELADATKSAKSASKDAGKAITTMFQVAADAYVDLTNIKGAAAFYMTDAYAATERLRALRTRVDNAEQTLEDREAYRDFAKKGLWDAYKGFLRDDVPSQPEAEATVAEVTDIRKANAV